MDIKIKQRLVGTAVLVGFAVILLPIVFHGNDIKDQNITLSPVAAKAPSKPEVTIFVAKQEKIVKSKRRHIELVSKERLAQHNKKQQKQAKQSYSRLAPLETLSTKIATRPASHPTHKRSGIKKSRDIKASKTTTKQTKKKSFTKKKGQGWIIQLASFHEEHNAKKFENQLRKKGYHAHVERMVTSKHTLYRVLIGPTKSKIVAHRLLIKLTKKEKMKGLLLHATPGSLG